jgi:ribosomal protein L11 methyltransferase
MMMNFIETSISIDKVEGIDSEIIVAELAECGYESFVTENGQLKAYVQEELFDTGVVSEIFTNLGINNQSVTHVTMERQNWNEQWESNYEPIPVDDFCYIRAPFHEPVSGFEHQLVITPKMSFGTGHHQTTKLMIKAMRNVDFKNLSVLDMGCGTGILAILAKQLGAGKVVAIDIDPWATENSRENFEINKTPDISCFTGDSSDISGMFDVILANINRNILLKDMALYAQHLNPNGQLFMSGFYESDNPLITNEAVAQGLQLAGKINDDQWLCLHFRK